MDFLAEIQGISYIIQLFMVFLTAIYAFFAFLVVRQTGLLNRSFQTDAAKLLTTLAKIHLFGALAAFVFALLGLL